MKESLIKELSSLTTIKGYDLEYLLDLVNLCISHNVYEDIKDHKKTSRIDLGIGTLLISIDSDNVFYKFFPSSELEDIIVSTILDKKDYLQDKLELTLKNRIIKAYKELV